MNEFLYEGYFMDGQYEGQGTLINKVGDIYVEKSFFINRLGNLKRGKLMERVL
jgi:hypothetical protein